MNRRRGITLLEVLIAIFVMGVGLLALLTLFPVGALSMRQALRDSRAHQAAANARSTAVAVDVRNDPVVRNIMDPELTDNTLKIFPNIPGTPVFVDPVGSFTLGKLGQIPRVRPTGLNNLAQVMPWFSLPDDLEFDAGGNAGPSVIRGNRTTWGLMLRRPRAADPSVATMAVVVYHNRPVVTPPDENLATYKVSAAVVDPGSVTLAYAGEVPGIRVGTWILDNSLDSSPAAGIHGKIHCYFYRVVGVTELGAGQLQLDLQTPLKKWAIPSQIAVLEDVAEVFEQGTGWAP